jgi:hypothetical protein
VKFRSWNQTICRVITDRKHWCDFPSPCGQLTSYHHVGHYCHACTTGHNAAYHVVSDDERLIFQLIANEFASWLVGARDENTGLGRYSNRGTIQHKSTIIHRVALIRHPHPITTISCSSVHNRSQSRTVCWFGCQTVAFDFECVWLGGLMVDWCTTEFEIATIRNWNVLIRSQIGCLSIGQFVRSLNTDTFGYNLVHLFPIINMSEYASLESLASISDTVVRKTRTILIASWCSWISNSSVLDRIHTCYCECSMVR